MLSLRQAGCEMPTEDVQGKLMFKSPPCWPGPRRTPSSSTHQLHPHLTDEKTEPRAMKGQEAFGVAEKLWKQTRLQIPLVLIST